jgi:phage-related protein
MPDDFTYQPTFGFSVDHAPRILSAQFGDGYEQRAGDGINTDPETWALVFENEPDVDFTAIMAFFATKLGRTAFTWTPKGGSQGKYLCKTWNGRYVNPNVNTITATFKQTFDP